MPTVVRALALFSLTVYPLSAQFKSAVPPVIAPTSVTDAKRRLVDGLTGSQLMLYDNNVRQTIQVESVIDPVLLVDLIEASSSSERADAALAEIPQRRATS
jgi:hypothetical protein